MGYFALHVLTFLFVRYYLLKEHYRVFNSKQYDKIKAEHGPFMRNDIGVFGKLHLFWSFPWYCTFWPRFIFSWSIAITTSLLVFLISVSNNNSNQMS